MPGNRRGRFPGMAEQTVRAGGVLDFLTRHELRDELTRHQAAISEREQLRAIKPIRFLIQATGANPFALGGASGEMAVGPESGFVWSVRHLVIEGMTTGTTPDVVNIKRSGSDRIIWQLNGNVFCQTWGRGEILLNAGENLRFESVGTFAATGAIVCHGMAECVPGEMAGRFFGS